MDNYTTCPQCWCTFEATSAARIAELESLLALEQSANARLRAEALGQRAEASYLRACVPPTHPTDYGHEVWTETVRAAVEAERAAVVAWLHYAADTRYYDCCCGPVAACADDIERGEHRRQENE